MKKSLHIRKVFTALLLALALVFPTVSLWDINLLAASDEAGFVLANLDGDCISTGYAADAFEVDILPFEAFGGFEPVPSSGLIGNIVRTWGSQFALSSAAEWNIAQNPSGSSTHIVPANIIVNSTIGFEADPNALAAYRRDERGALTLAPGVLTATYETAPFAVNNFTHMINSFGADTPDGTWIEVWVRVGRSSDDLATIAWLPVNYPATIPAHLSANTHSAANVADGFLTSGRWSPFSQNFEQGIRRTTSTNAIAGGAQQATGSLIVSGAPANVVQYRVTLHRDSAAIDSPVVRQVHGTTRNAQIDLTSQPKEFPEYEFPARSFNGQSFPGGNTAQFATVDDILAYLAARPIDMDRQGWNRGSGDTSVVLSPGTGTGIYLQGFPMRSQQATGPILGGVNCSAVTIGMIANGFLNMEGITPLRPMEEVGLNLFDYQLNGFGNWQFSVAGAGTYGLRAHVEYNDRHATDNNIMMETILRHLVSGHAVGLSLQFSSVSNAPHFIPRTDGTTSGHLIVLLGVVQRSGNWYVIVYEPWAGSGANANDRVYREFPMENLVNAMRFSGANGTHNIIYVVKPGVEPGAGTAAPIRLESHLIPVAPGEFALSTDGTTAGIIAIGGMDRGQIGGPSGFIAYTTNPAFNFMGTTISNPHGQAGTKFRYLPIGNTVRFGYDAHISPVQPFTHEQLTDPNFRMYIMMGNGFTHVIDSTRVPSVGDLYPELRSPGGQFRVNNPLRTVAPNAISLSVGTTTIGTIRTGLEATLGSQFAIFSSGTVINSVADFNGATPKADSGILANGDFIVVVNSGQTIFARFEIDYFGLGFENSGVGETVRLDLHNFTQDGSPNFHPWSNPLTGWSGTGRVVYTAASVANVGGTVVHAFPLNATDTQLRSFATNDYANIGLRFVEADGGSPGGFRLIPYSTTGEIMPWRGGLVRITATIDADNSSDPFDGESRSFYVRILGGGPGANGANMHIGEYETGNLITPSFTWGTFRVPVVDERTYNLNFSNTQVLPGPSINITGRPLAPITFPYTPHPTDRPHWTFNTTWDGSVYTFATSTRVNWFWQPDDGVRQAVPLDANHGYEFQPGTVYIAELFLASAMHPTNTTWMNMPAAGAAFDAFIDNIAGVPNPGENGIANIEFSRNANHLLLATITFEQLPGTRPSPGPIDQLGFEHSDVGETVELTFYDVTRDGSPNFYPWANRLTGWSGPGRVVYTVTGIAPTAVALVDDNLNVVSSNETGLIMPWRGGTAGGEAITATVTATIEADDSNDPFDGLSISYIVQPRAGGFAALGNPGYAIRANEGFTWGSFANPAVGEQAFSVAFSNTAANAFIPFGGGSIPSDANVVFPYTPYTNERPLFVFGQTWDGTPYNGGVAHGTRIAWFRELSGGGREQVPQGHHFTANTVYIAELTLASNMTPANNTWINFPVGVPAGNTFASFISNARGLPIIGQNGVRDFEVWQGNPLGTGNLGWNVTFRLTFDPLDEPVRPTYPLTVLANAGGTVADDAGGMIAAGMPVSVLATPNTGYQFDSWTVAGATITGGNTANPAVLVMPSNAVTLTANFEGIPPSVTGVAVSPAAIEVEVGTTQQFSATVEGAFSPSQGVIWRVSGYDFAQTEISANGLLSVYTGETAATLTVTATSMADSAHSDTATVTVTNAPPAPVYSISLNVSGTHIFSSATVGYGAQSPLTVNITNTGNQPTGGLNVVISGDEAAFTLSQIGLINGVAVGGSDILTVTPADGLSAGEYTALITISGVNVSPQSFNVVFTVTPPPAFPVGFAANGVMQNGITATGAIAPTGNQEAGTPITVTVTLLGTAGVAGTHTIGLTSASGVVITPPETITRAVTAGESLMAGTDTPTFNFTMPAAAVGDLTVVHTFAPSNVTVTIPVTGVTISGMNVSSLNIGHTLGLSANIVPVNATNRTVTWQSSNPAVATVNGGVVTAVSAGSAIITVSTSDGGFSATVVVNVVPAPPPSDIGQGDDSSGSDGWQPPAQPQQPSQPPATATATQNHTNIQNQLARIPAGDVNAVVTLTASAATNNILLQGSSLNSLVQAGVPLAVRSANGAVELELPVTFLSEFHRRGTANGSFEITVVPGQAGSNLAAFDISFRARNNEVARFQNSYTITANLDGLLTANMNRMRVIAMENGRNIGGAFTTGALFEFEARAADNFTITHLGDLRRINVQLDTFTIRDLAGNGQTLTMDVLPVIQNDRTLLPIRFMAYALGAEVDWNSVTAEVTLTLDGERLTFAIGETAPGMDVPAQIINERTMVPLRFISEFFGATVTWDEAARNIEIVR